MTFPSVDGVELLSVFQISPFRVIAIVFFLSLSVVGICILFLAMRSYDNEAVLGIVGFSIAFLSFIISLAICRTYKPTYLVSISDTANWETIIETFYDIEHVVDDRWTVKVIDTGD